MKWVFAGVIISLLLCIILQMPEFLIVVVILLFIGQIIKWISPDSNQSADRSLSQINTDLAKELETKMVKTPSGGQRQNHSHSYSFYLRGVHLEKYKDKLRECSEGDEVVLKKEPSNPYDDKAVKVLADGKNIGYVPRAETDMVRLIMKGEYAAFLENIINIDGYMDASIVIHYDAEAEA